MILLRTHTILILLGFIFCLGNNAPLVAQSNLLTSPSTSNNNSLVANCKITLDIYLDAYTGTATILPQDLDAGGSTGGDLYIRDTNFVWHNNYTFQCSHIGIHSFDLLVVADSINQIYDHCSVTINVLDTANTCAPPAVSDCVAAIQLYLDSTGMAQLVPADLDQGNSYGTLHISDPNFVWNSSLSFSCHDLGTSYLWLVAADSISSSVDYCPVQVEITDTIGSCSESGTYTINDAIFEDASDCSVCDGRYYFGGLMDLSTNTIAPSPYTFLWSDGSTSGHRNDLCPNTLYTLTVFDAHQYAYQKDIAVSCGTGTPFTVHAFVQHTSCNLGSACDGRATINAQGGTAPYTYAWSGGQTTLPAAQSLCAGWYMVTVTDALNNQQVKNFILKNERGCVWAGDTDNNSLVNNFDILPIALTYGETGYSRINASLDWQGQTADNWYTVNPIPFLPNYKHIDADGNGTINQNDLLGIEQNYTQDYVRNANYERSLSGDIPLFVEELTVAPQERVTVPIHLGTASQLANNIYGLAFTVNYDPDYIDGSNLSLDFSNSWLGSDLLTIYQVFDQEGRIEIAVSRKDKLNISGFGEIGSLNLTIRDIVFRGPIPSEETEVWIDRVRLIDNQNQVWGTALPNSTWLIQEGLTAVQSNNAADFEVSIFPNPSKDQIQIQSFSAEITQVELINMMGQSLSLRKINHDQIINLLLDGLSTGTYTLRITTTKGVRNEQLHIVK
ncbi:MAG: T9SS type A sorting domain-containing protein [Saprospiraceae bacterium]|nr:T9SS type A sorting domain-containing protein [Saprospiraceae bacterium]